MSKYLSQYPIYNDSLESLSRELLNHLSHENKFKYLTCINPHSYAVAKKSPIFNSALTNSNWLVPDGIGVVAGYNFINKSKISRITGSDIFFLVNNILENNCASVFFLGSTKEVLDDIEMKFRADYPSIKFSGSYSPPFKDNFTAEDDEQMIERINSANADVLWVGMTSPKQDIWIYQNRNFLNVKFAAGIGAVFDFYTGRIQRPNQMMQRMGLEWLFRFFKEPSRLWKRIFISTPIFLLDIFKEKYG